MSIGLSSSVIVFCQHIEPLLRKVRKVNIISLLAKANSTQSAFTHNQPIFIRSKEFMMEGNTRGVDELVRNYEIKNHPQIKQSLDKKPIHSR